jgi:hypothetical protein
LALFVLGIGCLQGFATSVQAQDIAGAVVPPAVPNSPVVVAGTPQVPVVVPVSSDYVFPHYRSDDVLTQRNDNNRTGTSHVAGINQHTVTPGRFKRLGAFPVNGVVLSQPLYVHRAMVNNVVQPVLVVATSNNDVYAFSPFENRPNGCGIGGSAGRLSAGPETLLLLRRVLTVRPMPSQAGRSPVRSPLNSRMASSASSPRR